jgi:hypothetical protein
MLGRVGASDDVGRIAVAAEGFTANGERVEAVLVTEPAAERRTYLVAFATAADERRWLALDASGDAITSRDRVRDAVAIAAMVEVVEDALDQPAQATAPRVASPQYLDALGAADAGAVGAAIHGAAGAVEELARDVVTHYKLELT